MMDISPETLSDLFSKLEIDNEQSAALRKLRSVVVSLSFSPDFSKLIDVAEFRRIFDSLNTADGEQLYIASDLLTRLLSRLDPDTVLNSYKRELLQGLGHSNTLVKLLALEQILRFATNEQVLPKLVEDFQFSLAAIKLIGDLQLNVYETATEVVIKMVRTEKGLALLTTPQCIAEFEDLMKMSESIRYRVFGLTVQICKISPMHITRCVEIGTLPALLSELKKEDVVIQLKCLELLSELGSRDYGVKFLEEQGTIKQAETMLNEVGTDPVTSYLTPGLVKFFGNMVHVHPKEIIHKHPRFVSCLLELLQDEYDYPLKTPLKMYVVNLIGILGSTVDGKIALHKQGEKMNNCMKQLGGLMADSIPEMRVNAINAVVSLLDLQIEDQTTELLTITELWFHQLQDTPMEFVMNLCKELYCKYNGPSWALCCALGKQPWGLLEIKRPGFLEIILDRTITFEKEAKEMKHEFVRQLISSPLAKQILGTDFITKLNEFYKVGPIYVPPRDYLPAEPETIG